MVTADAGALRRSVIGQFRRPHGVLGRVAGWVMANRPSNRRRNMWTVELLNVRPGDRVLEIGYGPGLALADAVDRVGPGTVYGLDHSETMRGVAAARSRRALADGRLRLHVGRVEDLAAGAMSNLDGPFDRIYGINTAMFWSDRAAIFGTLADRLAPGGRIAVTHQPRTGERTDAAADLAADAIAADMCAAGLADVHIARLRELSPMAVCVMGHAP